MKLEKNGKVWDITDKMQIEAFKRDGWKEAVPTSTPAQQPTQARPGGNANAVQK